MPRAAPFIAVALVVAAGAAAAQDRTAQVDSIFDFATARTPGCAVGVARHGKVLVRRAYGLADVDERIPLTADTKFDIGSTHKQFVAAAVALLVKDGRIALSDDIRKYLPELPDYGHTVTIEHLLTHTSGIRDWPALLPLAPDGSDALQLILRQRSLNFAPGEEWSYSSSGFVLLKEIVARVSGTPFAEVARTRLFEPLGMRSSEYVEDIMQGSGTRAIGYQKTADGWKEFMRLGNERGGGTVITTVGDLLTWNDALTNDRLGPSVTALLEKRARLNSGRTLTHAHGLIVSTAGTEPMISHSGGAAGFSSWLGRFPREGLSVAVACNFDPVSATELAGRTADLYLPRESGKAPPGPVAAEGVDVGGRAGLFFEEGTGSPMRLGSDGTRLAVATGPVLVPVSDNQFRPRRPSLFFRSEDDFTLTFTSPDEFVLTSMEGDTARYRRAEPWTPTAADLGALDGRYGSTEVGSVIEILPSPPGIALRLERSPDESVPLEPVARDTYMQRLMILRVRRDAAGAVTGIDYGNPVVRSIAFTRLGDRKPSSPPLTVAASGGAPAGGEGSSAAGATDSVSRPATPADAAPVPALEGLVGAYEMAPGRRITITLEGGQLYGEPTGSARRPLVHVRGATFGVGRADSPMMVTFELGAGGRATAMIMRQNGNERRLTRVP